MRVAEGVLAVPIPICQHLSDSDAQAWELCSQLLLRTHGLSSSWSLNPIPYSYRFPSYEMLQLCHSCEPQEGNGEGWKLSDPVVGTAV